MIDKLKGQSYAVCFTYILIACSMLSVFPVQIAGMDILPAIVFLISILWMLMNIIQINQGKKKVELKYSRLPIVFLLLMVYELGVIAVSMMQEIEEGAPEPDYSWNLLLIGLALLYLLSAEEKKFQTGYLDAMLYSGLVVMAILLLGYLYDTQIGEFTFLWADKTASASYLIPISVVSVLQYSRCEEQMKSWFYVCCAGLSFFLLACSQRVVSFWIVAFSLLLIPVLVRPTAYLCKRVMQMLLLFLAMISSMSLIANDTGLFLMPVEYDPEHGVCLGLVTAVLGVVFFYCLDRLPKGVKHERIVMRGFYRIDKCILKGMLIFFFLFAAGGVVWQSQERESFSARMIQGFAGPLSGELAKNYSLICEQGMTGILLIVGVLVLFMEQISKGWAWNRPMRGLLGAVAVSMLLQILLWEVCPNLLPIAVILAAGACGCEEEKKRVIQARPQPPDLPDISSEKQKDEEAQEKQERQEKKERQDKQEEGAGSVEKKNGKNKSHTKSGSKSASHGGHKHGYSAGHSGNPRRSTGAGTGRKGRSRKQ